MYCEKCGCENNNESKFCRSCGSVLNNTINTNMQNYSNTSNSSKVNANTPNAISFALAMLAALIMVVALFSEDMHPDERDVLGAFSGVSAIMSLLISLVFRKKINALGWVGIIFSGLIVVFLAAIILL